MSRQPSPLVWDAQGAPRSRLFDDIYFSRADGLGEARQVFLEGCGLPERWAGQPRFCVAELGFGVGRAVAALLELWKRTRPPGGFLSIFSVEAFPVGASEATRALAVWPELAGAAAALTTHWPGEARGFHRIDLPDFAASLDVAILEASEALDQWTSRADAWFLDGFSPARNPQMWTPELLARVAHRSVPGARAASYTVAGQVRRDLAAAGFTVERLSGAGTKRSRLEARLPGRPITPPRLPKVAIIGGGIAGASLARAFTTLGCLAEVIDAVGPGAGASGAPAALVAPRLDAGLGAPAALFAQAARRAIALYDQVAAAVLTRGVVQFATGAKDGGRFAAIAASDLFEPASMIEITAEDAAARLGERAGPGLEMTKAAAIDPAAVLGAWLPAVRTGAVAGLEAGETGWRGVGADGHAIFEADVVCLAAGMDCARLTSDLPLIAVRGQASIAQGMAVGANAAFGGYVITGPGGAVFGATHDRGETDTAPRGGDTARNLAALRAVLPRLADRLESAPIVAWAAIRATTADYLPIAGPLGGGLFALTGLGSRGFTLAPLLAEHIAALALGRPSPLPADLAALVAPGQFAARAARRRDRAGARSRLPRV